MWLLCSIKQAAKISSNFRSYQFQLNFALKMSSETIKKVKKSLKIGTHSGHFHCDEIFACYMLQTLEKYRDAEIVRTRDLEILKDCDIVVDVGQVFDPASNRFDHHQRSFQETLSTLKPKLGSNYNTRLSSAGLIYAFFGEEVIENLLESNAQITLSASQLEHVYKKVYENFVQEIDAIDNGVPICEGKPKYRITTNLSARVGNFYPAWNSKEPFDENATFNELKSYVGKEFLDKVLYYSKIWLPARDIVEKAIDDAKNTHPNGEIIEFPICCPWQEHLFDIEKDKNIQGLIKYVIFSDKSDDWRVMCVPVEVKSFVCRKCLHKDWRGLQQNQIRELSKVPDAVFCHSTGFIGGAKSRDGAFQMAVKSLSCEDL